MATGWMSATIPRRRHENSGDDPETIACSGRVHEPIFSADRYFAGPLPDADLADADALIRVSVGRRISAASPSAFALATLYRLQR